MKHIRKNNEPQEILEWKKTDKMFQRGNPKWNRLPTTHKDLLREELKREQGYLCCYCERKLEHGDYHIEHIKPKGISKYEKYAIDYDNLICSCQLELENGEPRHCGNSKGSWYHDSLYISPLDPNCEAKFRYTFDGHILAETEDDNEAQTTILKLSLNIDKLIALRKAVIDPFLDDTLTERELSDFINGYLVQKENNNGQYNQFYTTIKYLFLTDIQP
jgi:uncharacterized protein (TIGR02646 family)